MNLITFREFFRKQSGRFDLVDSSFADTGSDVFILAGQKYLDRLADIPEGISRRIIDIEIGEWLAQFKNCRAVLEVWVQRINSDGDISRVPLNYKTERELRGIDATYGVTGYTDMPSTLGRGVPLYYTPVSLRVSKDEDEQTGGISGFLDLLATDSSLYNGIVFFPPTDIACSIEVMGNFYSQELVNDTDANFWSSEHPTILYMSVMRQLEIIHRNTEGVKDWDASILAEMVTIDMDGVAQNSTEDTHMRG